MMRNRIVLLDLEECLIDDWFSRNVLHYNIEKIKQSGILMPDQSMGVHDVKVGLMSWAVANTADVADFNANLREPIEEALGVKFHQAWPISMQDYADKVFEARLMRVSTEDMYDVFRKEEVLLTLARKSDHFEGREVVLIDDAVDHNLTFTVHMRHKHGSATQTPVGTVVRFINIDQPVNTWQFTKRKG